MNINYICSGDYFIPDLKLPEETRPIGKWGRMHREHLKEHHSIQYTNLILSCKLRTYLADLNEQAQERLDRIMQQMKEAEGVTETLKATDPMAWVQRMNSIRNQAEEIILHEMIYGEESAWTFWKNSGMAILTRQNTMLVPMQNTRRYCN